MPTFYNFTDNSENLVSYSTYNASTWSNIFPANATLSTGIDAPDGSNTAIRMTCATSGFSLLRVTFPPFTPNGTDTYTTSFYVRRISGTTSTSGTLDADLADGNPYGDYLPRLTTNTWVRVSFSAVPTATSKTFIDLLGNVNDYVLDFWGVQIEKKSFVGAYVPTNGDIVPGGNGLVYSFDDIFVPADLFRQGNLWMWGNNSQGQLGINASAVVRSTPVTTFAGGNNWKQSSAISLTAAAIKTDGTLWTWGLNDDGELGINATTNRSVPVTTFAGGNDWKQISTSGTGMAAIKTDGTLWTWGDGANGRLGNNATTARRTPVTTFAGGTNWKQVSDTSAIKTDGTLWTWGSNSFGQLGNNTLTSTSTPVTTFAGGTNWKQVSSLSLNTVAIKTDGTLWTWGSNSSGQLGINNTVGSRTPVTTFAGGTNWKQVYCSGTGVTLAIKTDGTLWVWGQNSSSDLGINDNIDRLTPVTTFAGGNNWKQVSDSRAIKTDGTLWVWGFNNQGQLGTNNTTRQSTPVTTFAGGNNWKECSASSAITYEDSVI